MWFVIYLIIFCFSFGLINWYSGWVSVGFGVIVLMFV